MAFIIICNFHELKLYLVNWLLVIPVMWWFMSPQECAPVTPAVYLPVPAQAASCVLVALAF